MAGDGPAAASRIYYYGDSGPHGDWSSFDDDQRFPPSDAWGTCPVREVPTELWERYVAARELVEQLQGQIDTEAVPSDLPHKHYPNDPMGKMPSAPIGATGNCFQCQREIRKTSHGIGTYELVEDHG